MMPLCSKEDQSLVQPSQVGIQQPLRCFRIFQTSVWSWQMWQTCIQRTRTFLSWELEWGKALRVYRVTLDETQKNSAFLMGAQDPSSMVNTRGTEAVQQEMVKTGEKAVGNKAGVKKLNFWECQTKEWILWERETRAVALGHENMSGLECNAVIWYQRKGAWATLSSREAVEAHRDTLNFILVWFSSSGSCPWSRKRKCHLRFVMRLFGKNPIHTKESKQWLPLNCYCWF